MKKHSILIAIAAFGLLILILQTFFLYFDIYDHAWWSDILMHILGGAWVAMIGEYWLFLRDSDSKFKGGFWLKLILIVSFVSLVGFFWEFYEFSLDQILLTTHQQSLPDTMGDLFNDILGGAVVSCFLNKK
ncbi:MAG TPA: hypothetical protein P5056_01755 [Candidatus Paceibacterota bacterium]|nr:hypothetical protein [Candidatus Paceibacterota bacterium]